MKEGLKKKIVLISIRQPEASLGYKITLKKKRGRKWLTFVISEEIIEWSRLKLLVENAIEELYV